MSTVVNEVTPFAQYEASAGADTFQYTWWIREETDLKVYVDGELVATTDYTVSGTQTSTGGNVVFDTPLTGGEIVTISTDYPFERLTGFATSGSLRAAALNLELSYLVACILQLQRDIQRTLKLSPSSQVDTTALVLPEPEDQRILYWNGTEGVISNSAFGIDVLEGNAADIAANLTAINALYTQLESIVNVSENLGPTGAVTVVAANLANILAATAAVANIALVAGSITNINAVAAAIADIITIAGSIASVITVAGSIANVNTVAAANSNISTVVTNIADIQAAPQAAIDAAAAQMAAEAARDATLASFDSFDDRYLGAKSSDPTLDNDGNALAAGSIYFNTVDGVMKVYTGSAWVSAYVSGADFLAKANNLSDLNNTSTARTNLGLGTSATLNTGTSAGNVVVLDGSARLPAVDGSQLTGITAGAATTSAAGIVELATNAEVQTGTDTARVPSVSSMQAGKIVYGTAVATTSGLSKDFTGIPSWAKRVTIRLYGVTGGGTFQTLFQLGTGGSPTTSGYQSSSTDFNGSAQGGAASTIGFATNGNPQPCNATFTFERFDESSNTWFCRGMFNSDSSAQSGFTHGTVTLSGALNMIRLRTVDNLVSFTAGSACASWE